eukprot:5447-Heterococcus_DN1.PRE.1
MIDRHTLNREEASAKHHLSSTHSEGAGGSNCNIANQTATCKVVYKSVHIVRESGWVREGGCTHHRG